MLKFTIDGRSVTTQDLEKEFLRVARAKVEEQIRTRVSSIRYPETGEFPTVIVEGDTLDDMTIRVEGTKGLLEIVQARLAPEELSSLTFVATDAQTSVPRVFLSYGWEDRELARKIAEGLQGNGIETWWAEWEIGAGESIRRKIDEGLGACTHFIVLLSPNSIARPWVNEEIDAGYMRKVASKCRFIPLRYGIEPSALPSLMQGMYSPAVEAAATDLKQLVNDIHGVSRKPALGQAPDLVSKPKTGYTAASTAIAEIFVKETRDGVFGDIQIGIDDLVKRTGLTTDDLKDALHELRHRLTLHFDVVIPKSTLYSEFDRYWQPWDPAKDALKLAADLVSDPAMPSDPSKIGERYDWAPRRLNSAITYLEERAAIDTSDALCSNPFVTIRVLKTDETRRFVKSRS